MQNGMLIKLVHGDTIIMIQITILNMGSYTIGIPPIQFQMETKMYVLQDGMYPLNLNGLF